MYNMYMRKVFGDCLLEGQRIVLVGLFCSVIGLFCSVKVFGDCLLEGQRIVLKCIRKSSSPAENRIVFREIDIHGSLVHPNIAACHGFYEVCQCQ